MAEVKTRPKPALVKLDRARRARLQEIVLTELYDLMGGYQVEPQEIGLEADTHWTCQGELAARLSVVVDLGGVLNQVGWPDFKLALGYPQVAASGETDGRDLQMVEGVVRGLACLKRRAETLKADADDPSRLRDRYAEEVAFLDSILREAG
jgi:hypothetical protein